MTIHYFSNLLHRLKLCLHYICTIKGKALIHNNFKADVSSVSPTSVRIIINNALNQPLSIPGHFINLNIRREHLNLFIIRASLGKE